MTACHTGYNYLPEEGKYLMTLRKLSSKLSSSWQCLPLRMKALIALFFFPSFKLIIKALLIFAIFE
jgi:hypothetical protein